MAAAGIGPSKGPGFLEVTSLLEQELLLGIEDKSGKTPMQGCSVSVDFGFGHGSQDMVLMVD